jgi:hypothetical protein
VDPNVAVAPTIASGTDYTEATLPLIARLLSAAHAPVPDTPNFAGASDYTACVAAVQASHPGTPVLVDIARYRGSPAVIVLLVQDDHRLIAVATGPSCGLNGADELASVVFD